MLREVKVDNVFSVGNSFDLFLKNRRLMVPVLLGHTYSEFFSAPNVKTLEELMDMAVEMFEDDADEYLKLCKIQLDNIDEVQRKASVNILEYTVRIIEQANADTGANMPMYYYNFDAEIPGWDNPGTFHSVDLWFFFETLAKCWRPFVGKYYDLARQMCTTGLILYVLEIQMVKILMERRCHIGSPTLLKHRMEWYSEIKLSL